MGSNRNGKSVGECSDLKINNSLREHTCFCFLVFATEVSDSD